MSRLRTSRRRPRFALVLALLLLVFAGALALIGTRRPRPAVPLTLASPPARQCVTATAHASATAHSAVSAHVTVTLPVTASAVARRGGRITTVTVSAALTEKVRLVRPVSLQSFAAVARRACAWGASLQAARGRALRLAYAQALKAARARASANARRRIRVVVGEVAPSAQVQARNRATAEALAALPAARERLAQQARARVGR